MMPYDQWKPASSTLGFGTLKKRVGSMRNEVQRVSIRSQKGKRCKMCCCPDPKTTILTGSEACFQAVLSSSYNDILHIPPSNDHSTGSKVTRLEERKQENYKGYNF